MSAAAEPSRGLLDGDYVAADVLRAELSRVTGLADVLFRPDQATDNGKPADRARRFCEPAARKTPTYLAVDHYHLGNPMAAVLALSRERF